MSGSWQTIRCLECGEQGFIDPDGVAHHGEPDEIDHDADAGHVALAEPPEDAGATVWLVTRQTQDENSLRVAPQISVCGSLDAAREVARDWLTITFDGARETPELVAIRENAMGQIEAIPVSGHGAHEIKLGADVWLWVQPAQVE